VEIHIEGLDRLSQKLGMLATLQALVDPMEETQNLVLGRMATYPPQRVGSSYVRTGTLGRRWTSTTPAMTGTELRGKVGNNTVYGPMVQSQQFQSRVHRNRWQTDAQVMERSLPDIIRLFERRVQEILR
jgi:hypothetical protein